MKSNLHFIDAAGNLTSTPNATDGVLAVCLGEQISLTCTHDNIGNAVSRWFVSGQIQTDSINCNEGILHGVQTTTTCGPLEIIMISDTSNSILSSTARTVVTESLNGAIVGCFDRAHPELAVQLGNITIKLIGEYYALYFVLVLLRVLSYLSICRSHSKS